MNPDGVGECVGTNLLDDVPNKFDMYRELMVAQAWLWR